MNAGESRFHATCFTPQETARFPMRVRAARFLGAAGLLAAASVGLLWSPSRQIVADDDTPAAGPTPVESDMHEFMEYLFEPSYKRLREALASAPADNAVWKGIKGDALTLAEGANLLFGRGPAAQAAAWDEHAASVREAGAALYAAGKAKDYDPAREAFLDLLGRCNACHDTFADGEHQLVP